MPVLYALLNALFVPLIWIISIYKYVIIARALVSWVNPDPYNPIVRALYMMTEPVMKPFRKIISPYRTGGLDFSPVFAILALWALEIFLRTLYIMVASPVAGNAGRFL